MATADLAGRCGPLAGVRVLSLAEQYPGPYATLLLADLGADVILVERPHGGDPSRRFPAFFEALNRNKRSVALDLKRPEAVRAFQRLVAQADVLLEGYRPGTMRRLGLDHERLLEVNPMLVYVSISGFGQDGPYRERPAHDLTYQAMAGLLGGAPDTPPGGSPSLSLADLSAGLFGAVGALTGLVGRARSGCGTYVDVAMFDALASLLTTQLVPLANGAEPNVIGRDPGYGLFATADGRLLSLSVSFEDHFWRRLCAAVGLPQLAEIGADDRLQRHAELRDALAQAIEARPLAHWSRALEAADVPFGPLQDLRQVLDDPQLAARGLLRRLDADGGPRTFLRQPLMVDGTGPGPRRGAPRLGEHSIEVLRDAGCSVEELDALAQATAMPPST